MLWGARVQTPPAGPCMRTSMLVSTNSGVLRVAISVVTLRTSLFTSSPDPFNCPWNPLRPLKKLETA